MQGGLIGHGLDRNEFLWRRAQWFNDPARLMILMANYMSEYSFSNRTPHLEGEEVFGFAKQSVDCLLGVDNDFHHPHHVNLFCPRITVLAVRPNIIGDVSR